jgi:hypothetical protein
MPPAGNLVWIVNAARVLLKRMALIAKDIVTEYQIFRREAKLSTGQHMAAGTDIRKLPVLSPGSHLNGWIGWFEEIIIPKRLRPEKIGNVVMVDGNEYELVEIYDIISLSVEPCYGACQRFARDVGMHDFIRSYQENPIRIDGADEFLLSN